MLPTAESAPSDDLAAVILANVSGREVPRATNVMAVTASDIPKQHPNNPATSPTKNVIIPIMEIPTPNAAHPPQAWAGGMQAKKIFQPIVKK